MPKRIIWLDQYLLTALAGFLLIFIPLYPKWPLFDILPGYNVRVRLEDILILLANGCLLIQLLRRRIRIKQAPLFKPILGYLLIGLLSVISAILITKTVYHEWIQIAKAGLHWFRRAEYFSLFFIFFFGLRSVRQLRLFLMILVTAVLGVTVYGFGQKYLYWPAYSTMNREFAKGIALYLTEHARVLSTFGGHFDLAAYVMMTIIPLILLMFLLKSLIGRLVLLLLVLAEYWLLILSASRTSWLAYIAGITVAFGILLLKKSRSWVFWRWLAIVVISTGIMISFGDLSERFSHIFKLAGVKQVLLRPFRQPPKNGIPLAQNLTPEQQLSLVATQTDIPPSPAKEPVKPLDVYDDTYERLQAYLASTSGEVFNVNYSQNALKYGLSAGIRLDTLWPNAIKAFKRNPLLGTGYSTLVKEHVWEFTIAESTDNDFLRMLGETGLLGLISFLMILYWAVRRLWQAFLKSKDPFQYGLLASGVAITIGLLVNAMYIDVFESSKIAYTYWSILGLLLGLAEIVVYAKKT